MLGIAKMDYQIPSEEKPEKEECDEY